MSEGKPQRFGTQFEWLPDGPKLGEVEDSKSSSLRRTGAGLDPIPAGYKEMADEPRPAQSEFAAKNEAEMNWRIEVGWCPPGQA